MERNYTTGVKDDVIYFTGVEIEHTPACGMRTLFVVGLRHPQDVISKAKTADCKHIFVGANQSFDPMRALVGSSNLYDDIEPWDNMITDLLNDGFIVTLDFDIDYVQVILEMKCQTHINFIPQISAKIPDIKKLNYNTMLKIDDTDFKASNPGVWCHKLHNLMNDNVFTGWREYEKDEPL
jgi:hypothetical protein